MELIHSGLKNILSRIYQQGKVETRLERIPLQPVRLPAQPPRQVPFHRVAVLPGEGKNDPVVRTPVCQHKQPGAGAGNNLSPLKNIPNFVPSLDMFVLPEPETVIHAGKIL
jgi:hypothetical protein